MSATRHKQPEIEPEPQLILHVVLRGDDYTAYMQLRAQYEGRLNKPMKATEVVRMAINDANNAA